ncbi:MAG: hypothetical protein ACRCZY_09175 [Phocaeicola sp.]
MSVEVAPRSKGNSASSLGIPKSMICGRLPSEEVELEEAVLCGWGFKATFAK